MNSNSNNENSLLNNQQSSVDFPNIFTSNPISMPETENTTVNDSQVLENQQNLSNNNSQPVAQQQPLSDASFVSEPYQNEAPVGGKAIEEQQNNYSNNSQIKLNLPLEYVDPSIVQPDLSGDNEESEVKKFKKTILPIGIIIIVILALIFITNSEMNSLFGNSLIDECPEGWSLTKNKKYCTITTKSKNSDYIEALLVGDIVNENGEELPDGKVTFNDYTIVKSSIEEGKELNEQQKLIYDLNGDGEVNDKDISDYSNLTQDDFNLTIRYVCPPKDVLVKGTTKNNGTETETITDYVLDNNQCRKVIQTTKKKLSNSYKNRSKTDLDTSTEVQDSTDNTVSTINTNTKVIVVFDASEGTVNGKLKISKTIIIGSSIGVLPDATRDGYKFVGWYYGNKKISNNWIPEKSVIVRAHWEK